MRGWKPKLVAEVVLAEDEPLVAEEKDKSLNFRSVVLWLALRSFIPLCIKV